MPDMTKHCRSIPACMAGKEHHMTPPLFKHQETGARWLMERPYGLLAFEMRCGKTRTAIEAAQRLFLEGKVDRVVVIAPAPVRDEWYDPDLGQIARYRQPGFPFAVTKYQARPLRWGAEIRGGYVHLDWIVTNYEFVRRAERLEALLPFCDARTVLVLDESLAVKSPTAQQTKACARLRRRCGRTWLLNGTPEGDNPGDTFGQYQMLDPMAPGLGGPRLQASQTLGVSNWWQFRARYGILGGFKGKQIISWTNLDDLRRRTSPHTLRVTLNEVFKDMPTALDPVTLTVPLSDESWRIYQEMKKDAIVYLESGTVTAAQAGVRVLRLSQITSGFLGGVEEDDDNEGPPLACVREIGVEKQDALLEWLGLRFEENPNFKAVLWCRFRAEAERLEAKLRANSTREFPLATALLYGSQRADDRKRALHLLHPQTAGPGPAIVVGTARTGGFGLNFAAASTMVYVSSDYSLVTRRQSSARILGPDQKRPAAYFDVVATGPDGQRTVDHAVLKALRKKEDVASWTAGQWARVLKEE